MIPVMSVGTYRVTIEAPGFTKAIRENVIVEAAVPRVLDTTLQVGEVSAAVNVTDSASLATPTTATTFRQLSGQELLEVPTSTRSFTHLLSAEAGVSADLPPVLTNGNGNISPSVNGTRTTSTSLSFNGVDATNLTSNEGSLTNNIAPAPETLSEVKLQTSLYDASTGRSGGGNFQLITKSGTKQLHGSVYWYLAEREVQRQRFLLQQGWHRPPEGAPQRRRLHHGRPGQSRTSFSSSAAISARRPSRASFPRRAAYRASAGAQLISGARTKENLFAAFAQLESRHHGLYSEAQCDSPTWPFRLLNI